MRSRSRAGIPMPWSTTEMRTTSLAPRDPGAPGFADRATRSAPSGATWSVRAGVPSAPGPGSPGPAPLATPGSPGPAPLAIPGFPGPASFGRATPGAGTEGTEPGSGAPPTGPSADTRADTVTSLPSYE